MSLLNAALNSLFDVLLRPLAALPPLASLALVSLATAIVMRLIVRPTSNQRAVTDVKRRIHAAQFALRLFNDDLRAIFRAQIELLRHNLTYLRLSLVPMLWMIVPFVFVLAQLQFQYGYQGLETGRPVLLTAHMRSSDTASHEGPSGIRADTGAVVFPAAKTASGWPCRSALWWSSRANSSSSVGKCVSRSRASPGAREPAATSVRRASNRARFTPPGRPARGTP